MTKLLAKVSNLQLEAERAGHALVWHVQEQTDTVQSTKLVDLSASKAAALVNNCKQSDVVLKIGAELWHGHSALLSNHSQFFFY